MTLPLPDTSESQVSTAEPPRILSCSGPELLPLARSLLQEGCRFRMRAPGLSMGRTIRHAERIEVAPCQPHELRAGTIVFYEQEGDPVAHRIVGRQKSNGAVTFLVRGDAFRSSAEIIPSEAVLGRVTAVWRDERWQPLPRRAGWCLLGRITPGATDWAGKVIDLMRAPAGRIMKAALGRGFVRRLLRRSARARTWRRAIPADRVLLTSFYYGWSPDQQEPDDLFPATVEDFPTEDFLLVEDGRRLIGAVGICPMESPPSGERPWRLFGMKVHWRYRGRGIGEQLLRAAMATVRRNGGSSLTMEVSEANTPTIALCEKYGFRQMAPRPQDATPADAGGPYTIKMGLKLGPREVSSSAPGPSMPTEPPVDGRPAERGPAHQLIYALLAGGGRMEESPLSSIDLPEEPFDWEGWLALVQREGLDGLFGHRCRVDDPDLRALPEAVRNRLAQRYYTTAACNLRLLEGAASAIELLHQAGVEVVVLKGAHLAEAVYPSAGCRPIGDVDLLIRPGAHSEAAQVMSRLGYEALTSPEPGAAGSIGVTLNASWWMHPDPDQPVLHLHWHLRNTSLPYGLVTTVDDGRLWADAEVFELAGRPVRGLAPHHLLLHLADHAVVHRYDRLMLLADMAAVIHRHGDGLEWSRLLDEARAFGLSSSLAISLRLAARYAAAPLPPTVHEALERVHLTFPERRFVDQLERYRGSILWGWLVYWSRCPTWPTRLRYLWLTIQPDPDRLALQTGGPTGWRGYLAFCIRRLSGSIRP